MFVKYVSPDSYVPQSPWLVDPLMVELAVLTTFIVPGAHAAFDSAMMLGSTPFGSPGFVPRHSAVLPPWAATHPCGAAGIEVVAVEAVDAPVAEDIGGVGVGTAGETAPLEEVDALLVFVIVQLPAAISLPNWATTWATEATAAWIPETSSAERLLPVARIFVNPCNICATCVSDVPTVALQDPPLFVVPIASVVGVDAGIVPPVTVGTMEKDVDPVAPDGVEIVIVWLPAGTSTRETSICDAF